MDYYMDEMNGDETIIHIKNLIKENNYQDVEIIGASTDNDKNII